MKKNIYSLLILVSSVLVSCGTESESGSLTTINVSLDNSESIGVEDKNIIKLETTDESLLYDISNLEVIDDCFVVRSRSMLKVFDKNGKYVRNIGTVGHGGNEYQSISNVFRDEDNISIYDFNKRAILTFNIAGDFLKKVAMPDNLNAMNIAPNHIYKGHDGYLIVNAYGGESTPRECLVKADETMTTTVKITGRTVSTGLSFPDEISPLGDEYIYWQPLCDTLFVTQGSQLYPLYHFDFGKYSVPSDVACKDVYERIDYLNKAYKSGKQVAGMIRYYAPHNNYLYFVCASPKDRIVLCALNRDNNQIKVYNFLFHNENMEVQPFLKLNGDKLYLSVIDKNDTSNPCLVELDINTLG